MSVALKCNGKDNSTFILLMGLLWYLFSAFQFFKWIYQLLEMKAKAEIREMHILFSGGFSPDFSEDHLHSQCSWSALCIP